MAHTPDHIDVRLDTTALDKINAGWRKEFAVVAQERADLVTLTSYMAEHDYTPLQIAYAVEKPWKFPDVLFDAKAAIEDAALEAEATR